MMKVLRRNSLSTYIRRASCVAFLLFAVCAIFQVGSAFADNTVMGSLEFKGKTKVEKTSGVWVDGEYVGYLKELKGSKQVSLLPGNHDILVRQDGYEDFRQSITIQPGEKQVISVVMARAPEQPMPTVTSQIKIDVMPKRAAVFVDGQFAGHVGEFEGAGRAMLIAPGPHHIRIALPGYNTFETDVTTVANQKVQVKTELAKSSEPLPDPLLKAQPSDSVATAPQAPPSPQ